MKSAVQSVISSWKNVFGFLVVALMVVDGSCRLNRAKAASDEDLQYPCPPGAARCVGLDSGDLEFWLYFCFDVPPSCRVNAEPPAAALTPAHQSKVPPSRPRLTMRGR